MRIGQVIYLSSSGCSLWRWNGEQFIQSPVATPVGVEPLPVVQEAGRLPGVPVGVLVDMVDEEHVRDVVPRLGRNDQRAMLTRKLARAFPRTAYRNATLQGRNPADPDEDSALLSALTRPEPLRILMDLLASAHLPVSVVISPALLVERLLDEQARSAPATLMVLRRSNERLQHSFFRYGRLCGSRRLRPTDRVEESVDLLIRQIEESLRYFDATFTAGPDIPLQLILPAADFTRFAAEVHLPDGWVASPIDMAEMRRRLRLPADVDVAVSEKLCIELLRSHAGTANYAPPEAQKRFQRFRVQAMVRVACIGLAVFSVAATLYNGLTIADTRQRMASLSVAAGSLESVLPEVQETGIAEGDPLRMRQVVTTYDALHVSHADPARILSAVSMAVSERPLIHIDAIRWGTTSSGADTNAVQASTDGGDKAAPATTSAITVVIRGHVEPFDGDFPFAFGELQAFMAALDRLPVVDRVTALVEPLDVNPGSTLTGELTPNAVTQQAPFTLELTVRSGDETV